MIDPLLALLWSYVVLIKHARPVPPAAGTCDRSHTLGAGSFSMASRAAPQPYLVSRVAPVSPSTAWISMPWEWRTGG